jgi:hypothetical protein
MKTIFTSLLFGIIFSPAIIAKETTRNANGSATAAYWQQRADYSVKASLDAEKKILTGTATITYQNNSPDTLRTIIWHLYQNVFLKNDGQFSRLNSETKGITVSSVTVNGSASTPVVDGTIMETPVSSPIIPKSSAAITVSLGI